MSVAFAIKKVCRIRKMPQPAFSTVWRAGNPRPIDRPQGRRHRGIIGEYPPPERDCKGPQGGGNCFHVGGLFRHTGQGGRNKAAAITGKEG